MGCDEIRELLPLHAGGDLDEADRESVEAHVALCGRCARELDQYREARSALATLREPVPPPGGWKDLKVRIEAELHPERSRRRASVFDELLRIAALALIGLAVGVAVRQLSRPAPSGPEPSAAAAPSGPPGEIPVFYAVRERAPSIPFDVGPAAPRPLFPESAPGSRYHLPRVEAIPAGLDKDY